MNNKLFYVKLFAILLAIFGARVWLIQYAGGSVPFWDQWDAEADMTFLPYLNGNLSVGHLFALHNEHIPFFTRSLALLLLILNQLQWDPVLEMVVNSVLYILTMVVFILIVRKLIGKAVENSVFLLAVLLLEIVPFGWENSLAGFQSMWYLVVLFTLIALWGSLYDCFSIPWWLGLISGVCAFLNLVSGFLVFIVIIAIQFYLMIVDRVNRRSHSITFLVSIIVSGSCVLFRQLFLHPAPMKTPQWNEFFLFIGKSLAWPWTAYPWLGLLFYLPMLALLVILLYKPEKPSKGQLFILGLGFWVILQVASFAYGRSNLGTEIASRYMDILAFGTLANLWASYFVLQNFHGIATRVTKLYACIWGILVIAGLYQLTFTFCVPEIMQKRSVNMEQLRNTRHFLISGDINSIKDKPFLHVPYPDPERLANLLGNPQIRRILPLTLTIPPLLQPHQAASSSVPDNSSGSTFVVNGFFPTTGTFQGEDTWGSYNQLGNATVGRFVSEPVRINQEFVLIPVAGYLGVEGLSLELAIEGKEAIIITSPAFARESWMPLFIRTSGQPFRLVATDNRSDTWFAFAMPRGIGWLSMETIWLLGKGQFLFFLGLVLFLLVSCYFSKACHLEPSYR